MADYLFVYFGGKAPSTPEEGEKEMQSWMKWMEKYGAKFHDPGNPVGQSYTVDKTGSTEGSAHPIMGYGIVTAESMEEALSIAESSPHLDVGGYVEVAEIIEIEM